MRPVPLPDFNAAWGEEQRRGVIAAIKKLVDDGKLPVGAGPPPR
jgi:hypothetical protein